VLQISSRRLARISPNDQTGCVQQRPHRVVDSVIGGLFGVRMCPDEDAAPATGIPADIRAASVAEDKQGRGLIEVSLTCNRRSHLTGR